MLHNVLPNTLIHIAVQTPLTRSLAPRVELPWVIAGVIIPDIPWILQRLMPQVDLFEPYQLRLYFTIQASLFFCLLISMAAASLAKNPLRVFCILAGNSLFHLILDAMQIKWGNGVHLLAPFSWQTTSLGLIWPEHYLGYVVSIVGILYISTKLRPIYQEGIAFRTTPPVLLISLSIAGYFLLPLTFMESLEKSDANYISTLGGKIDRTGKFVEVDRPYFTKEDSTIAIFSGEKIHIKGNLPDTSGTVSIKGKFTAAQTIESLSFHRHSKFRDYASIIGLSLSLCIWLSLLLQKILAQKNVGQRE